jgi:hypothetical protein
MSPTSYQAASPVLRASGGPPLADAQASAYASRMSTPSPQPMPAPRVRPHPDDEDDVREGFAEIEGGEGIALTADEADRWAETGELPEHVKKWQPAPSSSRRDT